MSASASLAAFGILVDDLVADRPFDGAGVAVAAAGEVGEHVTARPPREERRLARLVVGQRRDHRYEQREVAADREQVGVGRTTTSVHLSDR